MKSSNHVAFGYIRDGGTSDQLAANSLRRGQMAWHVEDNSGTRNLARVLVMIMPKHIGREDG